MMPVNTIIDAFFDNDAELFNVVTGVGPGDGINRIMFTARDQVSIDLYGMRETIVSFPDAVNLTDLQGKVNELVDVISKPREEVEATVYLEDDDDFSNIRIGDTVRVADRNYGFAAVGTVRELDWQDDSVRIFLGRRDYNLIDSINGREIDDDRNRKALGLPIPIGFRVQRAFPGVKVYVNQYTNSRAVGVEIHAAPMPGFTASRSTLFARGSETSYLLSGIPSGGIWYLKARSYDNRGEYSDFTAELSEVSGYVDGGSIEPGSITDLTPFASDIRPPRNVVNLPLVPAEGWEIDDLVVFENRLYRLESETGNVNDDWVPVVNTNDLVGQITGVQITENTITADNILGNTITADQIAGNTITADQIFGNTITAAQIAVGAIGADEIDTNAITAEKIQAGQVTASKINVDGNINVRSASNDGALRILNNSGTEVMRMGGGISSKAGVPSGIEFGLWGIAGTGIFIQGVPRVIHVEANPFINTSYADLPAGGGFGVAGSHSLTLTSFTVPVGKRYIPQISLKTVHVDGNSGFVIVSEFTHSVWATLDGTESGTSFFSGGNTYTNPRVVLVAKMYNPTSTTDNARVHTDFSLTMFEFDA